MIDTNPYWASFFDKNKIIKLYEKRKKDREL